MRSKRFASPPALPRYKGVRSCVPAHGYPYCLREVRLPFLNGLTWPRPRRIALYTAAYFWFRGVGGCPGHLKFILRPYPKKLKNQYPKRSRLGGGGLSSDVTRRPQTQTAVPSILSSRAGAVRGSFGRLTSWIARLPEAENLRPSRAPDV